METPAEEKISLTKKAEILAKNISDPVIQGALIALATVHPIWAGLLGFAKPIMDTWGDFGQERVNELVSYMAEHKEEFVTEAIESDNFKTLFLNILERHMKEASEEKRKLLRNYLLNVGRGVNPGFNEFTRMNNVMDDITLYEIDVLELWDTDGPIEAWYKNSRPPGVISRGITTVGELQTYVFGMSPRNDKWVKMVAEENKSTLNQTILLLGYKGLLYVLAENNFGSGHEARVLEITEFGKAFLAFIKA